MADWVEYFSKQTAPANLKETKTAVTEFAASHRASGRSVVLITVSITFFFASLVFLMSKQATNAMHNSTDNFSDYVLKFRVYIMNKMRNYMNMLNTRLDRDRNYFLLFL